MRHAARWISYGLFCLIALAAAGWGWLGLTAVSAADLPPLKAGDVVFQNTSDSQSLAILLASRSPYTHTGMIELDAAGKPWWWKRWGRCRPSRSTSGSGAARAAASPSSA